MKVVTIGRSPENDIKLDDQFIGRVHCQIIQHDDGTYTIVDLNSTNGTYINGQRISGEYQLQPFDSVTVGHTNIPWMSYFPPVPTPKKSKSKTLPVILISAGAVLLIAAAVLVFWWLKGGKSKGAEMCAYEPVSIEVSKGVTLEDALLKTASQLKGLKKADGTGGAKLIAETSADIAKYYQSSDAFTDRSLSIKPLHELKMHIDTTDACLFHRLIERDLHMESCKISATTSITDTHYAVEMDLQNETDKSLNCVLPLGSMIESDGLNAQNLVVTERKEVTLPPHQSVHVTVPAYSASQHRNSPAGTQGRITPYVMNAPTKTYQSQDSIWLYQQDQSENKITFYVWGRGDMTKRGEKSKTGHAFVKLGDKGYWGFGSQDGELFDAKGDIIDHKWLRQYATDSCSIFVTDLQLSQALSKIEKLKNSTPSYHFENYDGTAFVKEIADAAEVYYGRRSAIKSPSDFMKNVKRFNKIY